MYKQPIIYEECACLWKRMKLPILDKDDAIKRVAKRLGIKVGPNKDILLRHWTRYESRTESREQYGN